MIIGLTGYAQSGKDTVANILVDKYGFKRIAFADRLRNVVYDINPMIGGEPLKIKVDVEGWDKAKQHPEVRRLLQTTGLAIRTHVGEHSWIHAAFNDMSGSNKIVITDVRFTNEADEIKSFEGSQIWRIKRLGVDAVNRHVSETQMESYNVDQTFDNNGTIDELAELIKIRMSGLL